MNNKNLIGALAAMSILATGVPAVAGNQGHNGKFYDYARVVDVQPIYRTVRITTPRRECWDEERYTYDDSGYRSATPVIIGGLIGGAIGHQIGKGRGRDAATVAGALLGGSIARDAQRQNETGRYARRHEETVCNTYQDVSEEQRLEGYRVTYRYKGHTYTARMDHDPGDRVRVRVKVVLAE